MTNSTTYMRECAARPEGVLLVDAAISGMVKLAKREATPNTDKTTVWHQNSQRSFI